MYTKGLDRFTVSQIKCGNTVGLGEDMTTLENSSLKI
jgi:hypothetical protein